MRWLIPLFALTFCVLSGATIPPLLQQPLVQASIRADANAWVPGKNVRVAIHLTITPEWHIYWRNPGHSGLPTTVQWTLPPEFSATPLEMPLPTNFAQPGDIIGYGYKDTVTFLTTITVPKNAAMGSTPKIAANVSWLSCKDKCLPGEATVSLTLPVAAESTPTHAPLFSAAEASLPSLKSQALARDIQQAAKTTGPETQVTLDVTWAAAMKDVQAFPEVLENAEVSAAKITHNDKQSSITLTVRRLAGSKKAGNTLPVLLVFTDPQGQRHGFTAEIRLATTN